jgi:flagellar assembly protein FliH
MTQARPFLFDTDFRNPGGGGVRAAAAEAEERGRAAGIAQGLAQAQHSIPGRLAQAVERLGTQAAALLADADARHARLEEEAVAFALTLARKLAGEALDADPLGPIAEAAKEAFRHLAAVPHLAVRVNDALVEEVDALLARMARERGFSGRIVVIGEPDILLGDARLEWADGGVVHERRTTEAALAEAVMART